MVLRHLRDAELKGKRVLMRVDFNVPQDDEGNIIDDNKIKAALPTIEYILKQGARLILMSHLGRPKGQRDDKYSLKAVAKRLDSLIEANVYMSSETVGPQAAAAVAALKPGEVLLLENVRFCPGEEKNSPELSKQMAELGDIFVNDAFGSAHRAHSSTTGVGKFLPCYAGLLMEKEVKMLRRVLEYPEPPRMAILGGAKVADKIGLIENLLDKTAIVLIGGGMANTFLKAQGKNIGKSMFEEKFVAEAERLLKMAAYKNVELILPVDVVAAAELSPEAVPVIIDADSITDDLMILDIGPQTIELFKNAIKRAKTIIWNGPLGVYEFEQFANGTREISRALAEAQAITVIGGGDSSAAVISMGLEDKITHISTGGGATLEFLEGITLPGVAVCEE
ncbi:MAG TPA: phosphoglycerate kinase [Syntrophomonadaceae bacterium]|nr:phosphoglycerate kinase [Syntrophomonadaceae bacterium]HPR93847.1 phosphoglycerate kinase [Syntrophomonadaceae bacterium]